MTCSPAATRPVSRRFRTRTTPRILLQRTFVVLDTNNLARQLTVDFFTDIFLSMLLCPAVFPSRIGELLRYLRGRWKGRRRRLVGWYDLIRDRLSLLLGQVSHIHMINYFCRRWDISGIDTADGDRLLDFVLVFAPENAQSRSHNGGGGEEHTSGFRSR